MTYLPNEALWIRPNSKPLGRLGANAYSTLGDGFRLARPAWKNEQKDVEEALKESADVIAT